MNSCNIIFSNGENIIVHDETKLIGVYSFENEAKNLSDKEKLYYHKTTSLSSPLNLSMHPSAGLIPSLTEFLCNFEYFYLIENENKVFSSSAVVKMVSI
ncbi:TPA_asm: hypothetical protein GZV06_15325 [Listeria monocytogenes]|nr:hypothetical protein [Listeria monocytogenes]